MSAGESTKDMVGHRQLNCYLSEKHHIKQANRYLYLYEQQTLNTFSLKITPKKHTFSEKQHPQKHTFSEKHRNLHFEET